MQNYQPLDLWRLVVRTFGSYKCKQFAQNIEYMLHRFLERHIEFML